MRRRTSAAFFQLMTILLVVTQITWALPVPPPGSRAYIESEPREQDPLELLRIEGRKASKPVTVKRREVRLSALSSPSLPTFSEIPTDEEIFNARVLSEPFFPVGGESVPKERRELANAILDYIHGGGGEEVGPFLSFLSSRPDSVFRASIWANLGGVYQRTGYYSRALEAWETAWALLECEGEGNAKLIGDAVVGELSQLNASLGRVERLEEIVRQIAGRNLTGSATEKVSGAMDGLSLMRTEPEESFRCGPFALDRMLAHGDAEYSRPSSISLSRSTPKGLSLSDVRKLASDVGLQYQMAKRENREASFLVPSVAHWRSEHFAPLLEEKDGRFLVEDMTFQSRLWMSRKALLDESSGYFLVRAGILPPGWRPVDEVEGRTIWGKGTTAALNPENLKRCDKKRGGSSCCKGLATYSFHAMLVSLNINDTPLGYAPPRGPRVDFQVTYNQRESFQPTLFNYSNLGQKWTFDFLSYVEDNPSDANARVYVYARGGGRETHENKNALGFYTPHFETYAQLVQIEHGQDPVYERRLRDGSVEVFSRAALGTPRKIFMTEWRDPQGNALTFEYDESLHLRHIVDALGQDTEIFYELGDHRITKVMDPFQRTATFTYNSSGQLESITDVIGLVSSFEYGENDFITALTTPYGRTTFMMGQWDNNVPITYRNRWLEATDPLGGRERIEYLNRNQPFISGTVAPAEVPQGFIQNNTNLDFRNTYYWSKLQMEHHPGDYTKAEILHWLKDFDQTLTSGTLEGQKMPLEGRVWFKYPPRQQPVWTRGTSHQPTTVARVLDDGTTQTYRYEYNSRGKVTKSVDPKGRETLFEYDPNGIDLLRVKQKNGPVNDLLLEMSGYVNHQPATIKDASGQVTTYSYNEFGQLATIVTPERAAITENRTTTYEYDSDGYLERVTGPASGATTSYTYDEVGRVRNLTDSDGYTIAYEYDDLDRVTGITYPDGTSEETVYDKLDAVRTRDRDGRWTLRFYDALRRITASRDPLGRTVTQEWCRCGSIDALVDGSGNRTRWERDLQGRVTKEIRPSPPETPEIARFYQYGPRTGRLTRVTDPEGQHKDYTYDLDDNLIGVSYPNPNHPTANVSFTYDPAYNRVDTMNDGTGKTHYDYHPVGASPPLGAGNLWKVDGPLANDVITYTYDELGRLKARDINGVALTYAYDALGRITGEKNALGDFTFGYEGVTSRLSLVTYPNHQTTAYRYYGNSEDRRLLEIHHRKPGGATLSKFGYVYDDVGNILRWTQQSNTDPANTYDFEYDGADQLRAATFTSPSATKLYRYAYDPAGNRTVEQVDNSANLFAYDTMNRHTTQAAGGPVRFAGTVSEPAFVTIQSTPAVVTPDNRFESEVSLSAGSNQVVITARDLAGNQTQQPYTVEVSGDQKELQYDRNGNMTSDGTRTFEWDAEDRLVAVTVGTTTVASFVYNGMGQRFQKTAGGVTTTYVYDGEHIAEERPSTGGVARYRYGLFIDDVLAKQNTDGTVEYFAKDHLSSVRQVTNSAGAVTLSREFDPWGNPLSGGSTSGFSFTGREWDAEVGLYYYRARYYSAAVGRFLSEDPIGLEGGLNLYSYVLNNPSNLVDPTGTVWWIPAIILAFAYVFNNPTNANVETGPTVSPVVSNVVLTAVILGSATISSCPDPVSDPDSEDFTPDPEADTPDWPEGNERGTPESDSELYHKMYDEKLKQRGGRTGNFPDGTPFKDYEEAGRNTDQFHDELDRQIEELTGRRSPHPK